MIKLKTILVSLLLVWAAEVRAGSPPMIGIYGGGNNETQVRGADAGDTKLIVENDTSQVKIEVNTVFRGTVLPIERRPLNARTGDLFGVEFDAPILARDELHAGKLVATLTLYLKSHSVASWKHTWIYSLGMPCQRSMGGP